MHGLSNGSAMQLPKVYDFFKHSTMMDFGDGYGVYTIQVVKANPHMKATVLDLEANARWLNNISRAII
jgi:16S rRNA G1207 methylase RsmC